MDEPSAYKRQCLPERIPTLEKMFDLYDVPDLAECSARLVFGLTKIRRLIIAGRLSLQNSGDGGLDWLRPPGVGLSRS
jgi:hypothetical protein